MKKIILFAAALTVAFAADAQKPAESLRQWLAGGKATAIETESFASKSLDAGQAQEACDILWNAQKQETIEKFEGQWKNRAFEEGDMKLKFDAYAFGEEPEGGRSLWISMHGGGNCAPEVNDQQWDNQKRLYRPEEGVYFVPRAAVDDWNMWFRPHLDTLFANAIDYLVAARNINPDKVYLLGYSAGGDGVYRMAPRMADTWAAASMMAGHPGVSSPLNLRNVPYMVWMGGEDAAYDRNTLAAAYGRKLDSLQEADPKGYKHEVHILEGMGHWMLRADTAAIPWMAECVRNPYPEKVVWRQDTEPHVPHVSSYWLGTTLQHAMPGREAIVERDGNKFTILQNDYKVLQIRMNDQMVDFSKPVEVYYQGKRIFKGKVKRNIKNMYNTLRTRNDQRYIFSGIIEVTDNSKASAL